MNVPHETFSGYIDLLKKWSQKINLVSAKDLDNIWERHIIDSAQLMNYLSPKDHIIDVGSGAGLPGIILSILGIERVTLIESDQRKAAFLLQASKLSVNYIDILSVRVESLSLECDILTSRGFASIKNTLDLCKGLKVKKKFLFLKGEQVMKEIEEAQKFWNFEYSITPSVTSVNGCVVELVRL
ncbi:MAG: 16S rRNA (guanine(527)-N(7))-methyltransferase RsmG [Pseudomonadota bacterium]